MAQDKEAVMMLEWPLPTGPGRREVLASDWSSLPSILALSPVLVKTRVEPMGQEVLRLAAPSILIVRPIRRRARRVTEGTTSFSTRGEILSEITQDGPAQKVRLAVLNTLQKTFGGYKHQYVVLDSVH
ncbi:hypothetical protein N7471_013124 [Penicillium samsonianum]|uniref:uncharacterized protein n=1 Tax=Penicillium samsonianum TaxID=1882272 RepID=UPI0025471BB9|nr:uncharacterized protein N7471_013124 [Penicillium samsonianum]KAJ6118504.1 hypothetical protein N7471_013124 [Penicillium samsonianum]